MINSIAQIISFLIGIAISAIALLITPAYAQVYQWIDEQGKVHYSDRKPTKTQAENISDSVKQTNIDKSRDSTRKLEEVFTKESSSEAQYRRKKQREQEEQAQALANQCQKAREQLKTLQGRVYFVDKQGKEYNISEKERQQRVKAFEADIRKHCD